MKRNKSDLYLITLNNSRHYCCKIIVNKFIIDKKFVLIYDYAEREYHFINSRNIRTISCLGKAKIESIKNHLYDDAMSDIDKYNQELYCH